MPDGSTEWRRSPGGLVTALEPVMRANDGAWIGWPGGTETDLEPFEDDGLSLVPVSLTAEEIEEFYEGFSNGTLWPLYHDVVAKPEFHREWWDVLRRGQPAVRRAGRRGRRRGRRRCGCTTTSCSWCPQMLRELRPDLRIGFFLHIPFPPTELFQQLPWRRQILEGLLGADLVGFQLAGGAANFVRLVRQRVGHKTHRDLVYLPDGRTVRAAAFPISIDAAGFEELARSGVGRPSAPRRSARRSATPRKIFLGVDRLDYTKGIYARLRAFAELIEDGAPRRRRRGVRPGGDAVARAGRAVPHPARRHRPAGRPDQRRPRPDRPPGDLLPALVVPARGDGRALPGRRHHGGHAATATA